MVVRAQVALEFVSYLIVALVVVIVLVAVSARFLSRSYDSLALRDAQALASSLQEELLTAAQVREGYHRVLEVPLLLRHGASYSLSSTNDSLTVTHGSLTVTLRTPPLHGSLEKGKNVISHEQGVLFISQ